MALLATLGYRTVTLAAWGEWIRWRRPIPFRPIVLTFDDGYRSVHDLAAPVLERHGFGATVFLVSREIGGTNRWDADEVSLPLLGRSEIGALKAAGHDFQSHTATHARLTALSREAALDELRRSREELAQLLGAGVDTICYPYAAHSAEVEGLAREAGYRFGVTIRRRLNRPGSDLMQLRRIAVTPSTSPARLAWDLLRLRVHGD